QLTGAAAPVHDPDGRLVGVLMIAGGVRVARPEILALVKAAATAAEMDLLLTAMRADRHAPAGARERLEAAPDRGRLGLDVLGLGQPQQSIAAKLPALSRRHSETLLPLTQHPEGLGNHPHALLIADTTLDNGTI